MKTHTILTAVVLTTASYGQKQLPITLTAPDHMERAGTQRIIAWSALVVGGGLAYITKNQQEQAGKHTDIPLFYAGAAFGVCVGFNISAGVHDRKAAHLLRR